jgi:anti-sigma factor (TIGR02949 family)
MNCRDLETQLTAYLDGELIAEARVEVEAHLATCLTCPRSVEVERHNLSLIRATAQAGSPAAPAALRSRLFDQLARDAGRQRRTGVGRFAAVAATVTVAVAASHHGYRNHQRRLYEQDAALRHARQFPLEIQQPPEAIERWFGGKLDHKVMVPRFPNAQAAGARLLQVRDKPAAYIRYDLPRPMGLFVFGDDHDIDVGAEPALGSSNGYNVVSWRDGDVVYQLVTDLDERDLRDLVPRVHDASARPAPVRHTLEVQPASLRQGAPSPRAADSLTPREVGTSLAGPCRIPY